LTTFTQIRNTGNYRRLILTTAGQF